MPWTKKVKLDRTYSDERRKSRERRRRGIKERKGRETGYEREEILV